jgi:SAM-dependent methyltransferase
MNKEVFYKKFAGYYDFFHSQKNYKAEVERIAGLINQHKKSDGKNFLDVCCGTGRHLSYFKKYYSCSGIDINKPMISVAKKKVKGVNFYVGDMINFSLKRKFDVITCLYASIAYAKTNLILKKTIKNFADHLEVGGVIIIESFWTMKQYIKTRNSSGFHMEIYDGKKIKMARVGISEIKNKLLFRNKMTLLAEKGKKPIYFEDKRVTGLFETEEILLTMRQAGLEAKFIKKGLNYNWGICVGVRNL